MKALKVIGIIVGLLLALILVVPLFLANPATVVAETEIALMPEQIFPVVASFENRKSWDPWLLTDSTATAEINSIAGYVGSSYAWEGNGLGKGRMEVVSVQENSYIESDLYFGEVTEPSLVEWHFEAVDAGTKVVWSFSQDAPYPFGRLGMIFGKMFLKQSFDMGLAKLKEVMEANPPEKAMLGPIGVETQPSFSAMVVKQTGNMANVAEMMGNMFGLTMAEVAKQSLQMSGAPFADYTEFDPSTGGVTIVAGVQVSEAGVKAGEVVPVVYNEMEVLTAEHTGPYDKLRESYEVMMKYAEDQSIELSMEAFEFYWTDPQTEPDPAKWKTTISMPLK